MRKGKIGLNIVWFPGGKLALKKPSDFHINLSTQSIACHMETAHKLLFVDNILFLI